MNSTDIQWSAILSWGYADNILRLKSKQSEPPINFIQSSQQHQVSLGIRTACQLSSVSWKNEGGQLALILAVLVDVIVPAHLIRSQFGFACFFIERAVVNPSVYQFGAQCLNKMSSFHPGSIWLCS